MAVYGRVVNATGWRFDEVRAMKLRDWRRLTSHWDRHPPTCELLEFVAAGERWTPPAPAVQPTEDDLRALEALAAQGGA